MSGVQKGERMSIVIVKPPGVVMPTTKNLCICGLMCGDGCGYMASVYEHKIMISSGMGNEMDMLHNIKSFCNRNGLDYDDTTQKHAFVFHFRKAESGDANKWNCQPLPLVNLTGRLVSSFTVHDSGIALSGPIDMYRKGKNVGLNLLSSSIAMCLDLFGSIEFMDLVNNEKLSFLLSRVFGDSKAALLGSGGNLILYGKWQSVYGCLYSSALLGAKEIDIPKNESEHAVESAIYSQKCSVCGHFFKTTYNNKCLKCLRDEILNHDGGNRI